MSNQQKLTTLAAVAILQIVLIIFLLLMAPARASACEGVNASWCGKKHTASYSRAAIQKVTANHKYGKADRDRYVWLATKETELRNTAVCPHGTHKGLFQQRFSHVKKSRWANPYVATDKIIDYVESRYGSPAKAVAFRKRNGWF